MPDNFLRQLPFYEAIAPYITIIRPYIVTIISATTYTTTSVLLPLTRTLLNLLSSQSDNPITTVLILISTLFVGLVTLNWVRRQIFWWVGAILQLGFWVLLGLGGLLVWQFGPQKVLEFVATFYHELQDAHGRAEGGMKEGGREAYGGGVGKGYGLGSGKAKTGWR